MASTSSTLKFSPLAATTRLASSRDHTSLVKAAPRAMISAIFLSMVAKSSSLNGVSRLKS